MQKIPTVEEINTELQNLERKINVFKGLQQNAVRLSTSTNQTIEFTELSEMVNALLLEQLSQMTVMKNTMTNFKNQIVTGNIPQK